MQYKPFEEYAPGFGCRGICESKHELIISPKRYKGYTCQEEGIKYCKRCAVHWKKEAGLRCLCCNQRLKGRIRSKQSRIAREEMREEALSRQLQNSQEAREVHLAMLQTYNWYKCRSQCDFKTDNLLQAREHKEKLGHGIKRIPILIHQLLAKTKEETQLRS